jgi:hypothetical protein
MALQSMTALASITLQQASTSVVFSGIPENYRDLVIEVTGTGSSSGEYYLRFNNDSGSNYSSVVMYAPPVTRGSGTGATYIGASIGPSSPQPTIFQIIDYSATNKHKTVLHRTGLIVADGTFYVSANVNRWANTTGIASCSFTMPSGSFNSGSTFDVYGRIA